MIKDSPGCARTRALLLNGSIFAADLNRRYAFSSSRNANAASGVAGAREISSASVSFQNPYISKRAQTWLTGRRTVAENELNQKCKKRTLSCCSWLNSVSTALIRLAVDRYVRSLLP